MIPYGRQDIGDDDVRAVTDALTSGWLTQGPAVPRFEEALCKATGAAHAVAVTVNGPSPRRSRANPTGIIGPKQT